MNRFLPVAIIAAIVLLVSACDGGDDDDATAEPDPVTQSPAAGTAAVTTRAASPTATSQAGPDAKLPEDPCTLVSTEQVSALVPSPGAGRRVKQEEQPGVSLVACTWRGAALQVLNIEIVTLPEEARKSARDDILAEVRAGRAKEVTGLGEAASSSASQQLVLVRVFVKGLAVEIGYTEDRPTGPGAAAKLDAVIALARAIVAKL
jgi:Protein of unknown function (DUF3558)